MVSEIALLHNFVVELHMGIVVFIFLALFARLLVDLMAKWTPPGPRIQTIRQGTDFVAYAGALAAVVFLALSGTTGYLIQPYSMLVSLPLLMNESFAALGALFFWAAYLLLRILSGSVMWQRRGLYLVAMITAFLGTGFTSIAGSIGGELTFGQSVMDPVYQLLSIDFAKLTIQPVDIAITAAVVLVGIGLAAVLKPKRKPQ